MTHVTETPSTPISQTPLRQKNITTYPFVKGTSIVSITNEEFRILYVFSKVHRRDFFNRSPTRVSYSYLPKSRTSIYVGSTNDTNKRKIPSLN